MITKLFRSVLALASSPLLEPDFTYEVIPDGETKVHLVVGLRDPSGSAFTFVSFEDQPKGVQITLSSFRDRMQTPLPNSLPFAEACVVHKVNEVAIKMATALNFHLNVV